MWSPESTAPAGSGADRVGPAVLTVSLDSQIATGGAAIDGSRSMLGNSAERQRHYARHLAALHVVVKTRRGTAPARVPLAPNAWAYATNSWSRYVFVADAYRIAARICAGQAVDVISAQDPFATGLVAYLVARRFRRPLNVQVHFDVLDNPYWLREKLEHRPLNVLGKWLVRQADTVRVGTTIERDRLASWGVPRHLIFVAPVPVDLDRFATAAPDPSVRAGFAKGQPLVVAAARLVPQKDLPLLLRAVAQARSLLPSLRLAIAGDGPQEAALRALAERLGLADCVRFLGRVDHARMPALLAAADVVAVSSVYEGTSLVTIEAAAAGKPVVTTRVAGASDTVVDGVTGRIVPIGDAGALAGALVDVLRDPARAAAMGAAGRRHVLRCFDEETAIRRVVEMWWATTARPSIGPQPGGSKSPA